MCIRDRIIRVAGSLKAYPSPSSIDPSKLPRQVSLLGDPTSDPDANKADNANKPYTRLSGQIKITSNSSSGFTLSVDGFLFNGDSGGLSGIKCRNNTLMQPITVNLTRSEITASTADSVIALENCHAQLDRVIVRENLLTNSAHLVSSTKESGSLLISNSTIIGNTIKAASIIYTDNSVIRISNSVIAGNTANSSSYNLINCGSRRTESKLEYSVLAANINFTSTNCTEGDGIIRDIGMISDSDKLLTKTYLVNKSMCDSVHMLTFLSDKMNLVPDQAKFVRDVTCWDISGKKRPCNMSGNLLCPGASYPD